MAITLSGLILGLSLGRVLGGIISNFASWRDTYWLAVGLQGFAVFLEYWTLPDTPDKGIGLSYPAMLYSMLSYYFKYPTLVQACLSLYCNSCVFAGYWTVQTFLLSSTYSFSSLSIGLMGLLGFVGAVVAPFSGKLVDAVVPWLAQLIGLSLSFSGMLIALFTAEKSVVAVAISVTMFDVGNQLFQVSSSYRVAGLDPKARARLNGCVLLALFAGQTSGTAILTHIYNAHGWHPTGCTAVGLMSLSLLFLFTRGPHENGWIGWRGGASLRKRKVLGADDGPDAITEGARATGKPRESIADHEAAVVGAGDRKGEAVPMPLLQGEKAVEIASGPTERQPGSS